MNGKELLNCDLGTFGRWVEEHKNEFILHIPKVCRETYYEYFDENLCVQLNYEDFHEMLDYLKSFDDFKYHINVQDSYVDYCLKDKIVLRRYSFTYFL